MLTQKKKLRDRKHKLQKVYILIGLMGLGFVAAYIVSFKIFPQVTYISPLAAVLSDTSSHEDEDIGLIQESLKKSTIEVDTIDGKDAIYHIKLKNNAEIVLSAKKDLHSQLSSLQFIMSRLTMEGRKFSRLDLTFDKPVIVLEK